jgi:hypothetical protein
MKKQMILLMLAVMATALVMASSGAALAADQAKEDASNKASATNNNDLASTSAQKKPELAKGSGNSGTTLFSFNVKAKDTKAKTDIAEGNFKLTKDGTSFVEGNLKCLRTGTTADGSKIANFAGKVTKSNLLPVGLIISFESTDASSGDSLDLTSIGSVACTDPTGGTIPIDLGDIQIRPRSV